ncbi:MAG: ABC transporter permease, partial [Pseudomonadota bacterium]
MATTELDRPKSASPPEARDPEREATRRRWLLNLPAIVWLSLFAAGPLLVVILYSFLEAGSYGGVEWAFSTEGWFNVLLTRAHFDDTLQIHDAPLTNFWRSVRLSLLTTLLCLALGFPTP